MKKYSNEKLGGQIQRIAFSLVIMAILIVPLDSVGESRELTPSIGTQVSNKINPVLNQSGTAGYTGPLIKTTRSNIGSVLKVPLDVQVDGVSRFYVDSNQGVEFGGYTVLINGGVNQGILNAKTIYSGQAIAKFANNGSGFSDDMRLILSTKDANGGDPFIQFNIPAVSNYSIGVDNSINDNLTFSTGASLNSPKMVLTTSGKLGIGTTMPTQALDVIGNIKLLGNIVSDGDICIGVCQ